MLKKICPHCGADSYSSTTLGDPWLCPTCQADLTEVEASSPGPPYTPPPPEPKGFMAWLQKILK